MQSWQWTNPRWLQILNVAVFTVPATIIFAWGFFWFFEKPFMTKRTAISPAKKPSTDYADLSVESA